MGYVDGPAESIQTPSAPSTANEEVSQAKKAGTRPYRRRRPRDLREPDHHRTPQYRIRMSTATFDRLRSKAQSDGLIVENEIIRLLDIADHFDSLTLPDHPLALGYLPVIENAQVSMPFERHSAKPSATP
jgi:hypothetical protein